MTNAAPSGGNPEIVTGLFPDSESVERAYEVVVERGYDKGDVNVVMSEDTRRRFLAENGQVEPDLASKSAEGGELGGPTGGRISILIPIIAAVGASVALPGLIVAGPIAVALAGAGAAGVAAGLIAALADWGLPEERVRQYEAGIQDGGILMGVKARSAEDARYVEQRWRAIGGKHVHA
jgi:hypothetical protein